MEKKEFPFQGFQATQQITNCRFNIAPMSDDYIHIILDGIKRVNTQKVASTTDKISTMYCGKREHVVDCTKACFVNVHDDKTHITMEATFSKGWPSDDIDHRYLSTDDTLMNNTDKKFNILSKIAFYPLGIQEYKEHINYVVNLAKHKGLYKESFHHETLLEGDINDIFCYINDVMAYGEQYISHYVLQVALSVNSPSRD